MSAAIHVLLLHLMHSLYGQGQLHVSQKTDLMSIMKASYLMLCRDVIGIYVCGQRNI